MGKPARGAGVLNRRCPMTEEPEEARDEVEVSQEGDKVVLKAPAGVVTLSVDEAQDLAGRLVEASAQAMNVDPDENDWVRIPMQYIRIAAERLDTGLEGSEAPAPLGDEDIGDAKFAEVHCWIRDQTQRNAMHVAAGWIAEHGWFITEVIEQTAATRTDFAESEYLQYYEQALVDSEVFLYEIEEAESEETEGSTDAS